MVRVKRLRLIYCHFPEKQAGNGKKTGFQGFPPRKKEPDWPEEEEWSPVTAGREKAGAP